MTVIAAAEPWSIEHWLARIKLVALDARADIAGRAVALQHAVSGLEDGAGLVSEGLVDGSTRQLAGLANVNLNHLREANGLEFVGQSGLACRVDHAQLHGRFLRAGIDQHDGIASGVQVELRLFGADLRAQVTTHLLARHTGHRLAGLVYGLIRASEELLEANRSCLSPTS